MNTREVPQPWAAAMRREGHVSPAGQPSLRALARKAGISVETVRRMVWGVGESTQETVEAAAAALREDVLTVSRWAGVARSVSQPWQPPSEAALLTSRQQAALTELIRAMAQTSQMSEVETEHQRSAIEGIETVASDRSTPNGR